MEIIANNILTKSHERVQFRFPKSKKKRIRKKWFKDSRNFKMVEKEIIIKIEDKLIVSEETYNKLKNHYK